MRKTHTFRPGADQSSKAAFGKSAFAKTCYNVLSFVKDTTWRTPIEHKAKMLSSTFWYGSTESILLVARIKTCWKVLLLFARLVCASHIFNERKHVRACISKSAFAKNSFARLVCARPKLTWLQFLLREGNSAGIFRSLIIDGSTVVGLLLYLLHVQYSVELSVFLFKFVLLSYWLCFLCT